MKSLFHTFGPFLISALVCAALITLIMHYNGTGIMGVLGETTDSSLKEENYSTYKDAKTTNDIVTKKPIIAYTHKERLIKSNVPTDVTALFQATSTYTTDKILPVKILSIQKQDKRLYYWENDTNYANIHNFIFKEPGIYTVKVQAVDNEKQKTEETFQISVDDSM